MTSKTRLANTLVKHLQEAAVRQKDIWVIDGDLGDSYGLFRSDQSPVFSNFLQAGIAEQSMVAIAAGLAATGSKPWVFSFSAFLCNRACDQIRTCVAQASQPVVMVGSHAGAATGKNGKSHASLNDLSIMLGLGGISVFCPADEADIVELIDDLTRKPRPAYIRLSREEVGELTLAKTHPRSNEYIGEIIVLSTGFASHWVDEAVLALQRNGRVVPWVHICNIDTRTLIDLKEKRPNLKQIIVIEDHSIIGGLADSVRRVFDTSVKIHSLAWPSKWFGASGSIEEIREAFGLDTNSLCRYLEQSIERKNLI
jgi:transketolase